MKKLLVLAFSCVVLIAASGNVFAADIVYTISGDLQVLYNTDDPADAVNALVTWNFSANTDDVYEIPGGWGIPSMWRIDNFQGTVTISGLVPTPTALSQSYDIGSNISGINGVALTLNGIPEPIIWLTHNDMANYNLSSAIGPLSCEINGAPSTGPYSLDGGDYFEVWSSLLQPISFEATVVPIPSSLLLLGAGLALLTGCRKR